MFSLRNRFGIPGVISVIALVFAMLGGAYAASDNGGGKATSSAKAKRGPKGPKGATGPVGPAGPQGPAGANGKDGPNGTAGKDGATGPTGPTGATGPAGEDGQTGFTETLPPGMTETGSWSFGATTNGGAPGGGLTGFAHVPVSFSIPLEEALGAANVHLINTSGEEVKKTSSPFSVPIVEEEISPSIACTGTAAAPTAAPGHLCVYTAKKTTGAKVASNSIRSSANNITFGPAGTSTTGARINYLLEENSEGWGTWAVTAEE